MNDDYTKFTAKYSISHMNNSKWRKLFLAWAHSGIEIEHCVWSYIDSDNQDILPLPKVHDLSDVRFADGRFQPFEYKWIKNIKIPGKYKPFKGVGLNREQDITGLKHVAAKLGHYPIFDVAAGIEVRAYEL